MSDQEQLTEADHNKMNIVAAVLYGTVGGVISFAIWSTFFSIIGWMVLVALSAVIHLPTETLAFFVLGVVWLGSVVVNVLYLKHLRTTSRALAISFGISALLTALVVLYWAVSIIALSQIVPD